MAKFLKIRLRVSIASASWSYQVGQVALVPADLATAWLRVGHAEAVDPATPIGGGDVLADLSAMEALSFPCTHCSRRAETVFRNRPFCRRHARAELESEAL